MTNLREAASRAIYALEIAEDYIRSDLDHPVFLEDTQRDLGLILEVTETLESALARPEQEPIAWAVFVAKTPVWFGTSEQEAKQQQDFYKQHIKEPIALRPLYTAPQVSPPAGLKQAPDELIEAVHGALHTAWRFGQTYWQQADSESYSQWKKADETQAKFYALVYETINSLNGTVQSC